MLQMRFTDLTISFNLSHSNESNWRNEELPKKKKKKISPTNENACKGRIIISSLTCDRFEILHFYFFYFL